MTTLIRKAVPLAASPGVEPRTLRFVISTGDLDRMNDRIDPYGWELDEWMDNPAILFGHDHGIPVIARGIEIGVVDGKLKSTAEFPPEGMHPLADTVFNLAKAGFLTSASVGFMPLESHRNDEGGRDYTRQALHEWSVVNVPALAQARIEESRGAALAVQKWLTEREVRAARRLRREPRRPVFDPDSDFLVLNLEEERPQNRWRDYPGVPSEPVLIVAETYDIDPDEVRALVPVVLAALAAKELRRQLPALLRSLTGRLD